MKYGCYGLTVKNLLSERQLFRRKIKEVYCKINGGESVLKMVLMKL